MQKAIFAKVEVERSQTTVFLVYERQDALVALCQTGNLPSDEYHSSHDIISLNIYLEVNVIESLSLTLSQAS